MYLVTDDTQEQMRFQVKNDAINYAEHLFELGRSDICVWGLLRSTKIVRDLKWEIHGAPGHDEQP